MSRKTVTLKRVHKTDDYTLGIMIYERPLCFTLELPWLENRKNISCIPNGEYDVEFSGGRFQVLSVPGRTRIQIHVGNTVDDILGCVLVGRSVGLVGGKFGVTLSRLAFNDLMETVGDKFKLKIV